MKLADTFVFPFEISLCSWTHLCGPQSFFKNFFRMETRVRSPATSTKSRQALHACRPSEMQHTQHFALTIEKEFCGQKNETKLRHSFAKTFPSLSLFSANSKYILRATFEHSYFLPNIDQRLIWNEFEILNM